mmetsp:Transcript_7351/g.17766  ORF Transcript_7351/g.17766 Transcript_7351/m.17766 type:complete len:359 (-) Transcript_7351:140-1216(-)
MVSGSLPLGETSPNNTSTSAWPPACPRRKASRIALAPSAKDEGISTIPPWLRTTTTFLWFWIRASTRAMCWPGSRMWSRSNPSLSAISGRPTLTTTTSTPGRHAMATASSISVWSTSSPSASGSYPLAKGMLLITPLLPLSRNKNDSMASQALVILVAVTCADPMPWSRGESLAKLPIRATPNGFSLPPLPSLDSGRKPSRFCKRTMHSRAISRANRSCFSKSALATVPPLSLSLLLLLLLLDPSPGPSSFTKRATRAAHSSMAVSRRQGRRGDSASVLLPLLFLLLLLLSLPNLPEPPLPPHNSLRTSLSKAPFPGVPGISRSIPARRLSARSLIAPQSETTTPSKPHSSRRIDLSR